MGDRGMHRCAVAGWMLAMALTIALTTGCGAGDDARPNAARDVPARTTTAREAAARAKLLTTGQRIFDKQCSFCHRLNGKRAPRDPTPDAFGSSFDEIETSEAFVTDRITNGFGGMQSFSGELSPRQIRAVAMYVVANQGRDVDAPPASQEQLDAGDRVFAEHCQRCHSIAGRARTGDPAETTAGWEATDFRVVRPSVAFTRSVLDATGNFFMIELMQELQGKLTPPEIRDVAAFVNAVAKPGDPPKKPADG